MGKRKERISIKKAIRVLEEKHLDILTVYEWADEMGFSRSYFCRIFKKEFGLCPKDSLKDFRLKLIKREIQKAPKAIGYKIAVNVGLNDERSLHKFLYANFDINLTSLKQDMVIG